MGLAELIAVLIIVALIFAAVTRQVDFATVLIVLICLVVLFAFLGNRVWVR